jgi:ABC-type branched-subunit amino acid transport system substrate-binding protein
MHGTPEPVLVGVLDDTPGGMDRAALDAVLRLTTQRLAASGRFARGVELHHASAAGPPQGTARAVEQAFLELDDAGALVVIGPAIGDAALVATPLAEAAGLPLIQWAGTEEGRGEYMFHLQVGSHEEEPLVLVRYLLSQGVPSAVVLFERSVIGSRYARFFEEAALAEGLALDGWIGVAPGAPDVEAAVGKLLRAAPRALVYLGLGIDQARVAEALTSAGFDGRRLCNSCGMFGWSSAEAAKSYDGWVYVDVFDEQNARLQSVLRALDRPFERGPFPAVYADLVDLALEGVTRAPVLTRDGVREGLERIKGIPACMGAPGTVLSFGRHGRGALKGPYLVLRRWKGGRSVPGD